MTPVVNRRRQQGPDRRRVGLSVTADELALLRDAAGTAGLTLAAYCARAALATADRHVRAPAGPQRLLLVELHQARTQVVRIGTNLNQAVRVANREGRIPEQLADAASTAAEASRDLLGLAGRAAKDWGCGGDRQGDPGQAPRATS